MSAERVKSLKKLNELNLQDHIRASDVFDLLNIELEEERELLTKQGRDPFKSSVHRGNVYILESALGSWGTRRDFALTFLTGKAFVKRRDPALSRVYRLICDGLLKEPLYVATDSKSYNEGLQRAGQVRDSVSDNQSSFKQFSVIIAGIEYNREVFCGRGIDSPEAQRIYEDYERAFDQLMLIGL